MTERDAERAFNEWWRPACSPDWVAHFGFLAGYAAAEQRTSAAERELRAETHHTEDQQVAWPAASLELDAASATEA